MDEQELLSTVEKFFRGEMTAEEEKFFQDLRNSNPELDQTVVEHLYFLNELSSFTERKCFKEDIQHIANHLIQSGEIDNTAVKSESKVVFLWKKYKRTMAVAASIAGIVSIVIAGMNSTLSTGKQNNIKPLVDKIHQQENKTRQIENKINQLAAARNENTKPRVNSNFRATGFLIDADHNYIITNAHVVKEAKNQLVIENSKGDQYYAAPIYVNDLSDIAILQVTDTSFKKLHSFPYVLKKSSADLGEQVFMLGYPKQEIVYGEGYVSARNGFQMDTIFYQLSTSANEGTSGSPVINRHGELVGIISSKETNAEGVVFAIKSENITSAISEVKKLEGHKNIQFTSIPGLKGIDRVTQIKKVQDYVFMIKGN